MPVMILFPVISVHAFGENVENGRKHKFSETLFNIENLVLAQPCEVMHAAVGKSVQYPDYTSVVFETNRDQYSFIIDMPFNAFVEVVERRLHVLNGPEDRRDEGFTGVEISENVAASFPSDMPKELRDAIIEQMREAMAEVDEDDGGGNGGKTVN